jgi:hypothetical protein
MDKRNNTVIMALDFFEIINGFEEQGKADQPRGKEDNGEHTMEFASKPPNWAPERARRFPGSFQPRPANSDPVKMKRKFPEMKVPGQPPPSGQHVPRPRC